MVHNKTPTLGSRSSCPRSRDRMQSPLATSSSHASLTPSSKSRLFSPHPRSSPRSLRHPRADAVYPHIVPPPSINACRTSEGSGNQPISGQLKRANAVASPPNTSTLPRSGARLHANSLSRGSKPRACRPKVRFANIHAAPGERGRTGSLLSRVRSGEIGDRSATSLLRQDPPAPLAEQRLSMVQPILSAIGSNLPTGFGTGAVFCGAV